MSDWKKKRSIMHRYDQSAKAYDLQYSEEQTAKIQTALAHLSLSKNDDVLDAGCGTGILFAYLADEVRSVIGADISIGLLKEAKRKAKIHSSIELVLADADNLPFRNQMFSKAFAITLLQNMPNPSRALNEISRVNRLRARITVTGLRKSFTKQVFVELLKQTHLKVETLELDIQMREYVAVCSKKTPLTLNRTPKST